MFTSRERDGEGARYGYGIFIYTIVYTIYIIYKINKQQIHIVLLENIKTSLAKVALENNTGNPLLTIYNYTKFMADA